MQRFRSSALICVASSLVFSLTLADGPLHRVRNINTNGAQGSSPGPIVEAGGKLFFRAFDIPTGFELWTSDGTEAGTFMLKDIRVGLAGGNPRGLIALNGILLFTAFDGIPIFDGDHVIGQELWRSDGTASGTTPVADFRPGPSNFIFVDTFEREVLEFNGSIFFPANDGIHGTELWRSDGTEAGTFQVKDISPGPAGSNPANLVVAGDTLYFSAATPDHGVELWSSDGTEAGTVLVRDVNPGPANGSTPLAAVGATLYVIGNDDVVGREPWVSDGTPSGTMLLRDLNPGAEGSYISRATAFGNVLLFVADDEQHGLELWRSDGSEAGTWIVKDINPGPTSSIRGSLYPATNQLFFGAIDAAHGEELWRSDGTETGTFLVKDVRPGELPGVSGTADVVGEILLFGTYEGPQIGRRLWRSDGSEAGTRVVQDLAAIPGHHAFLGRRIFMPAGDPETDVELWGGWTAVVIQDPVRAVEDLIIELREAALPRGAETSLMVKLDAALAAMLRQNRRAALPPLEAFAQELRVRADPDRPTGDLLDFAEQVVRLVRETAE